MKFLHQNMIDDRKVIPEHPVGDVIDNNSLMLPGHKSSMAYLSGEGSIPTMDAVCVHLTPSGRKQMPDAVMYGIEEAFPVKWAALEYYGYSSHRRNA